MEPVRRGACDYRPRRDVPDVPCPAKSTGEMQPSSAIRFVPARIPTSVLPLFAVPPAIADEYGTASGRLAGSSAGSKPPERDECQCHASTRR